MASVEMQQNLRRNSEQLKSSIAMSVALVSFSMLFAALMLGYAVFRITAESWPPMGMAPVPLTFPLLSTFCILISSLTFHVFQKNFMANRKRAARDWLTLTVFLGFAFMGSQYLLWQQMIHELGYVVETGVFASLIHSFTWVHAAHIIAGLFWLVFLFPALSEKFEISAYENRVFCAGKFWHFLDLIWIIMFVTLFVI